ILEEAAELDAADDERYGEARGDELPVELRVAGDRRKRLREARQALDAEREADAEPIVRDRGARLRECRRRLEQGYEPERLLTAAEEELDAAGITDSLEIILADAGYWKNSAIEALAGQGLQPLIAPDADRRTEPRPGRRGGLYDFMRRVLATEHGTALYRRR